MTVELIARGAGTLVLVTHEGFPDEQSRDGHQAGGVADGARCARQGSVHYPLTDMNLVVSFPGTTQTTLADVGGNGYSLIRLMHA